MTNPADDADLPLWRIGVVVFANTRAVDYADASHIVERAVARAIKDDQKLALERGDFRWTVEVAEVRELSTALGNGFAYILPSTQAWRGYDRGESGGLPSSITDSFVPGEDY